MDEILAEEERVPVKWLNAARGVGFLDASNNGEDVARDAKMELPLWLADDLKGMNMLEVDLLASFSRKARADIRADAPTARLREQSQHFYTVGLRLGPLLNSGDEAAALSADVHGILADRAPGILQNARGLLGSDSSAYRGLLTDLEQGIFDGASVFEATRVAWRRGASHLLRPPAAALVGTASGGGAGGVTSAEDALRAASSMPQSRGQKRQRSLLASSGI